MAPHSPPDAVVAHNLALAVVASSFVPLLLLDKDLAVTAASSSFCKTFGVAQEEITGVRLYELGSGEWNVPQLSSASLRHRSGICGSGRL